MPSYQEKLTDWNRFCFNLKPLLKELPFLGEEQKQLESLVEKGLVLAERQRAEEQALRRTIEERREVERRCQSLRGYVAHVLRCKLGADDGRLATLGLKPREGQLRRRRPVRTGGGLSSSP